MTNSSRFIRFNFWSFNFTLLLFIFFYARVIGIVNTPDYISDLYLLILLVLLIASIIYRKKLGIKSNSALIFAEDERERSIIYKIHSNLVLFYTTTVFLLLLGIPFIPLLTSDIYTLLGVVAGILIFIAFLGNIIYYCTWVKYNQK